MSLSTEVETGTQCALLRTGSLTGSFFIKFIVSSLLDANNFYSASTTSSSFFDNEETPVTVGNGVDSIFDESIPKSFITALPPALLSSFFHFQFSLC